MKRLLVMVSLLLTSSLLFANCGQLGIQIKNESNHDCVFKSQAIYYGVLPQGAVPATIPAKTTSKFFYGIQDDIGVGILLTYSCGNEIVRFYSWQNYCSVLTGGAGEVGGTPYDVSTLSLSYDKTVGSALSGRPGQITWRIF